MFMSFFIRVAPFSAIFSCEDFRSSRNLLAACFRILDLYFLNCGWTLLNFWRDFIAFWRRGSVGLSERIFFAEALFGCRR